MITREVEVNREVVPSGELLLVNLERESFKLSLF